MLQVDLGGQALHLRLGPETPLGGPALAGAVRALPGARLSPEGVLRVPVAAGVPSLVALADVLQALESSLEHSRRAAV